VEWSTHGGFVNIESRCHRSARDGSGRVMRDNKKKRREQMKVRGRETRRVSGGNVPGTKDPKEDVHYRGSRKRQRETCDRHGVAFSFLALPSSSKQTE